MNLEGIVLGVCGFLLSSIVIWGSFWIRDINSRMRKMEMTVASHEDLLHRINDELKLMREDVKTIHSCNVKEMQSLANKLDDMINIIKKG